VHLWTCSYSPATSFFSISHPLVIHHHHHPLRFYSSPLFLWWDGNNNCWVAPHSITVQKNNSLVSLLPFFFILSPYSQLPRYGTTTTTREPSQECCGGWVGWWGKEGHTNKQHSIIIGVIIVLSRRMKTRESNRGIREREEEVEVPVWTRCSFLRRNLCGCAMAGGNCFWCRLFLYSPALSSTFRANARRKEGLNAFSLFTWARSRLTL